MTHASSPPSCPPAVRGGWRWWSPHPPTGAPSTGRSAPRNAPGAAGCTSTTTATATTPPTSHCHGIDDLLAGFTRILAGCTVLLRPGGTVVVTARPWRQHGELVDLPGAILAAGAAAGLIPAERCVALLAGLRGQRLIPRPSFFQLDNIRKARARGEPWHLIVHEDVLVFRAPGNCPSSARLRESQYGPGGPAGEAPAPGTRAA